MNTFITFILVASNVALFASCQHSHVVRLHHHHGHVQEWSAEFGTPNIGETICKLEGTTHQLHTEIPIPVPSDDTITYVSVKVIGESKPSINYDDVERTVCIDYNESDNPKSHYKIEVEGNPAQ